jgi:hypothetical protein
MARFLPSRALRVSRICVVASGSLCALICLPLLPPREVLAQGQPTINAIPVEVVATASEYVPTTVSHPGHSYTNCQGSTYYFGQFNSYGDSSSVSGTAETTTQCSTTSSPPTEGTTYRRVNYIIVKGEHALYLLSCNQTMEGKAKGFSEGSALVPALVGAFARTKCPVFALGSNYMLAVRNTSDARLADTSGGKPRKSDKLEFLSSTGLSVPSPESTSPPQANAVPSAEQAKVHITSSPSGGEIYVDGKFFGNTPSDITLIVGEHIVKVSVNGTEWSRTIQITSGEVSLHAELPVNK